ncbi:MAG: metalloregulator ArsR/SmtB family transcription factor [Meiothermus sp.]|nr:metalloregulator ArsR/SmtB family transcription factor [Meiothermus sp.]
MYADVFDAIAHPGRRLILERLRDHEQPVHALADQFEMSRPAVSQHLRVLLEAGLVRERRAGRRRLYRLEPTRLAEVHGWVTQFEQFWQARLGALGRFLEENPEAPEAGA